MSRRIFLARAAALGISASALGPVLAACATPDRPSATPPATPSPAPSTTPTAAPVITPSPSFGGTLPVVDPTPASATYGDMLETSAFAPASVPAALRLLLAEVATDAGIAVAPVTVEGRRQARISVITGDALFGPQAYRLEVAPTVDGPEVTVYAVDEAGACNGLLSLGRLVVADGSTTWLRAATVDDSPGFMSRGAILDPYVLPDVGLTDASKALLLERVRFGSRYKLNFVDLPDRVPWPELVRFCDDHHVEVIVSKGYRDRLTVTPRAEVVRQLDELLDAGTQSISLDWDDIPTTNPDALARQHGEIFLDLYRHLRSRLPDVRVSAVLPPYGGVPGQHLVGSNTGDGERYLALMRDALPTDVRVFWTGDGGVFSPTVTTAGARAYADAVGHELGLWDNDAIRFSRDRRACQGRAADLATVIHTYMGNLAGEAHWSGTNGEFALLTSLFYTWNPGAYDPDGAATAAERILASGGATTS
jgi:hypothetical protein